MEYRSIYIYGIVDGKLNISLSIKGIGNRNDEVFCIPYKDVTAIVSNTPFIEYDPTEENTLAHEAVIQEILKHDLTIAPMRFCTVLRKRDDVLKLMHSAYLPFKRNILRIKNKREYSVKVFLDIEKLKDETSEDRLIEKSQEMATELYERLKQKTEDSTLDEQIIENIILNANYLIHKEKVKEFYNEIEEFDKHHTDKLRIRISGPTAPYNFVDMPTTS